MSPSMAGWWRSAPDLSGFAWDNERPRHRVFLAPFALADRLVTNGEYLAFMEDGGYDNPALWLSDGWAAVRSQGWRSPLYWELSDAGWQVMTLGGMRPLNPAEPVCHLSYYEAEAFATWAGSRLPTEKRSGSTATTTSGLDAAMADPTTVRLGANAAAPSKSASQDVDLDGDLDLIFHFRTRDTGITCGTTSATLTDKTFARRRNGETDSVNPIERR